MYVQAPQTRLRIATAAREVPRQRESPRGSDHRPPPRPSRPVRGRGCRIGIRDAPPRLGTKGNSEKITARRAESTLEPFRF
jgi:hypothetical protein